MANATRLRFRRLDLVQIRSTAGLAMPALYRATLTCGHAEYDRPSPDVAAIVMFGFPRLCPFCTNGRNL